MTAVGESGWGTCKVLFRREREQVRPSLAAAARWGLGEVTKPQPPVLKGMTEVIAHGTYSTHDRRMRALGFRLIYHI